MAELAWVGQGPDLYQVPHPLHIYVYIYIYIYIYIHICLRLWEGCHESRRCSRDTYLPRVIYHLVYED